MAIDLLQYHIGEIKRWYRHELESFAWCLTYHMLSPRPTAWLSYDFSTVEKKCTFLQNVPLVTVKPEWGPYARALQLWMNSWNGIRALRSSDLLFNGRGKDPLIVREEQDSRVEDASYMRTATTLAKEAENVKQIMALQDITWIDVVLKKSE